jgi:protein-S-isoprenylcysteine O-methyltransferase Ste14
MNNKFLEYRPPRIAMALLAIAAAFHFFMQVQSVHLFSSILLAIALGAGGFAVMMWAWWQFQQHKVAICPTDPTDFLIQDGIYAYTRNPMYHGMVLMLLAGAILFVTLPFYIAAIAYFIVIDRIFCPYEEEKLLDTFGRDYETYRSRVRRWF